MRPYPEDFYDVILKAKKALYDIRTRARNGDGKHPTYENIYCLIDPSEEDLFCFWFYNEYQKWIHRGNTEPLMVDRINNMGHYELKNIQLIPMSINEKKKSEDHAIQYCGRIPNKEEKYCNNCKRILERENFHKDSHELDGLRGNCKECTKESNRKSKEKKLEDIIESELS